MRLLAILTATTALAFAGSALAAPLSGFQKEKALERATAQEAGSQTDISPSAIALTAGSDSTNVTVSGTYTLDDTGDLYGFTSISLKLSAPIAEKTKDGDFITDHGQVSGFSGELTFTRSFLPGHFSNPHRADSLAVLAKARQACRDDEKAEFPDTVCDTATYDKVSKFLSVNDRQPQIDADAAFNNANLVNVGASVSLGYDQHEYLDTTTFDSRSTERTPFSVTAFFGQVGPAANFGFGAADAIVSWRIGGEYKQAYDDPKARTLCKTPPAAGPQECFTGVFAKPGRTRTSDVFGILRWAPAPNEQLLGLKGFEAKAAYDFEHDVLGIGASLYLIADEKGQARGGLRANWQTNDNDRTTKDDNFTFGIFVGVPFTF